MIKCFDCMEEFRENMRGSKRIPTPLCPSCVLRRVIFTCPNCSETGSIKEGFYLCLCWDCRLEGCKRCITDEKFIKTIEFNFCNKHKNYDMKILNEEAEQLLEGERAAE